MRGSTCNSDTHSLAATFEKQGWLSPTKNTETSLVVLLYTCTVLHSKEQYWSQYLFWIHLKSFWWSHFIEAVCPVNMHSLVSAFQLGNLQLLFVLCNCKWNKLEFWTVWSVKQHLQSKNNILCSGNIFKKEINLWDNSFIYILKFFIYLFF